jgi:hypothetical protein
MPSTRVALRAGILVMAVAVSGCVNVGALQFRQDKRLHFEAPESRAEVTTPVTIRWRMDDFRVAAQGSEPPSTGSGYFALFVDRSPIKPGQGLDAVAHGDSFCRVEDGCPDRRYLAQRQVYTTTDTSFVLRQVLPLASNNDDVQLHEVVVVLLDTSGHRIGESFWYRQFKTERVGVS